MYLHFKTLLFLFINSLSVFIGSCGKGGGSGETNTSPPASTTTPPTDTDTPATSASPVAPWVGTKLLGVAGASTDAYAVSVDSSGNVYPAGSTQGNLDGQTKTGNDGLALVKYNISGIKQWTRLLGPLPTFSALGRGVGVDSSGNVYISGYISGQNFDGQSALGSLILGVVKYNTLGDKQWTQLLGAGVGTNTYTSRTGVDSSGNVYITGSTNGNLDGQTKTGTQDSIVVKYDTLGVKQWTRLSGIAATFSNSTGVSFDSSGNAYVAGSTTGNLDGQTKTGNRDLFLMKYNTSGVKQWTRLLGAAGGSFTYTSGTGVDSSDNAYVAGYTNGNLDGQIKAGTNDLFLVKYNSSGVKQWTRLLGVAASTNDVRGVSVDSSGNAYVTGFTDGNLDGQTKTGTYDLFLVKYNSSGTKQWTRLLGLTAASAFGTGVSLDSSGNAYVTGYTDGNLDGQTKTGTYDLFLVKYNSSGTKQ